MLKMMSIKCQFYILSIIWEKKLYCQWHPTYPNSPNKHNIKKMQKITCLTICIHIVFYPVSKEVIVKAEICVDTSSCSVGWARTVCSQFHVGILRVNLRKKVVKIIVRGYNMG